MTTYKVMITDHAKEQLKAYISYILEEFRNRQAAKAVRDDAAATMRRLQHVAGSLKMMENPNMKGYWKIHFLKHDYVMIYHIEGSMVYVDRIYHELQDYERKFE